MSESENPDRLRREVSVDDIRALAGPATPHFALQIRNRIRRLTAGLPPEHPASAEADRQIAILEELARHSGDPRGPGPQPEDPTVETLVDLEARHEST
jgi:hypothetical protein